MMNVEQFTIKVESIPQMQKLEQLNMLEKFNSFGFVLIQCQPSGNYKANLLALSKYFGKVIRHDHSDADGIVPVIVNDNNPEYVNTTNDELPLHTDGSFEINPPKVMALQCEIAASSGGLTKLVNGQVIYEYLAQTNPSELLTLFERDLITVRRKNRFATKPIFENKAGSIYMVFRSDSATQISIKPERVKLFDRIKEILENPKIQLIFQLQPNQILVTDNTKILHGRTAFENREYRKLNRLWFDGESEYSLKFGFHVKNELMV